MTGKGEKKHEQLFNLIAPVYGLFFNYQKKRYTRLIRKNLPRLDLPAGSRIVDIGCGTGALCAALQKYGFVVTGIDPADKMLAVARRKAGGTSIQFLQGDVVQGVPLPDKTFDLAIASYVAHGLPPEHRKRLYAEMSRLACRWVVIHDYNQRRSLLTSVIEYLEKGDYFRFIGTAEREMKDCVVEMRSCFADVQVIDVETRAAWYLCRPRDNPGE